MSNILVISRDNQIIVNREPVDIIFQTTEELSGNTDDKIAEELENLGIATIFYSKINLRVYMHDKSFIKLNLDFIVAQINQFFSFFPVVMNYQNQNPVRCRITVVADKKW